MRDRGIICDFDGVLVDSEAHWPATNDGIMRRILPHAPWTAEDHRRIVGHSMERVHELLVREYELDLDLAAYTGIVWEHASRIYDVLAQPMPGAVDFLERVRGQNARLAIASSNERAKIDTALKRLDLGRFFHAVRAVDDVGGKAKPDPTVYREAAFALELDPSRCLAIEDSPSGVKAAKLAGMHCVALRSQHNATHDLSLADTHIEHFGELTVERVRSLLG